jgi:hypothetical protein
VSKEIRLLPRKGAEAHADAEVIRRLRAEFTYVSLDAARGQASVARAIAAVQRMSPSVYEGAGAPKGSGPEHHRKHLEKLREAQSGAVHVTFGDSAEHALAHTLSEPDQGLLFVVEEAWEQQLVDRCAHAVEYDAHEI